MTFCDSRRVHSCVRDKSKQLLPRQAQFPKSKGALDDGYSHCPAPSSDGVREKMLELAPASLVPLSRVPEVQNLSMWGTTADMVRTSYELLGMGVLKYTCKGSREFTCVSLDNAVKIVDRICEKEGIPTPQAQSGSPLLKVLASFLHERLDKAGLAHISDLPDLVAYRATCPPNSFCFIPAGCIFSERTLNGCMAMGWRCSIVERQETRAMFDKFIKHGYFGQMTVEVLKKVIKDMEVAAAGSKPAPAPPAEPEPAAEAQATAAAAPVASAAERNECAGAGAKATGVKVPEPEPSMPSDASAAKGTGPGSDGSTPLPTATPKAALPAPATPAAKDCKDAKRAADPPSVAAEPKKKQRKS